jgi:hypothetical protein
LPWDGTKQLPGRSHCPIEVNETNVKFLRNERAWGLSQRELDRDRGSFAGLGSLGMLMHWSGSQVFTGLIG